MRSAPSKKMPAAVGLKFSQRATFAVQRLSGEERVVTDRNLPPDLARYADDVGLSITFAPPTVAERRVGHG